MCICSSIRPVCFRIDCKEALIRFTQKQLKMWGLKKALYQSFINLGYITLNNYS